DNFMGRWIVVRCAWRGGAGNRERPRTDTERRERPVSETRPANLEAGEGANLPEARGEGSLFRRLREIQGFYDSAAAFHFTFFQPLWIQPLWIQRLRLWIFGWWWNRRRTSHHYSAVSTCSNRPI